MNSQSHLSQTHRATEQAPGGRYGYGYGYIRVLSHGLLTCPPPDLAVQALTVADSREAWIFHIIPDHTGTSAIWAAQRVPDDHIALVANQFVIRGVPKDDPDNFMYSHNLWSAAIENKLWSPKDGEEAGRGVVCECQDHGQAPTVPLSRLLRATWPAICPRCRLRYVCLSDEC